MKDFRDILVEKRPFKEFEINCQQCGKTLCDKADLTESTFKNEVFIKYMIRSHRKSTGHGTIEGTIEPRGVLNTIDMTVEVNADG